MKMIKKTMTNEELKKEISIWAYKFIALYENSYPNGFVGLDQEDIEQYLWVWAIEAKSNYEKLDYSKKFQSMKAYIKAACRNRLLNFRKRFLYKVDTTHDISWDDVSEDTVLKIQETMELPRNQLQTKKSEAINNEIQFRNVKGAMYWYAKYRSVDYIPYKMGETQSYDDFICVAADISNILDRRSNILERNFTEEEKSLLFKVGVDGFEKTLQQMKQPDVGNNRRYLKKLVSAMHKHLARAGYIESKETRRRRNKKKAKNVPS